MFTYESDCLGCGLPCMGEMCSHFKVKHYYCDGCGDDDREIYEFDEQELCLSCIEDKLDKVN